MLVRRQPTVEDGEIAVVLIDEETTLKRVFKMAGRVQLRSENPAYPPMNFTEEDSCNVYILGKAIAFQGDVK